MPISGALGETLFSRIRNPLGRMIRGTCGWIQINMFSVEYCYLLFCLLISVECPDEFCRLLLEGGHQIRTFAISIIIYMFLPINYVLTEMPDVLWNERKRSNSEMSPYIKLSHWQKTPPFNRNSVHYASVGHIFLLVVPSFAEPGCRFSRLPQYLSLCQSNNVAPTVLGTKRHSPIRQTVWVIFHVTPAIAQYSHKPIILQCFEFLQVWGSSLLLSK